MQFLNKNVRGHVEVGHIDLLQTMSYFEVPEEDAERVIKYVNGQYYKKREVRCNDASEGGHRPAKPSKPARPAKSDRSNKPAKPAKPASKKTYKKDDWKQLMQPKYIKFKGEVPDFSEEGWAIRKPRKKNK